MSRGATHGGLSFRFLEILFRLYGLLFRFLEIVFNLHVLLFRFLEILFHLHEFLTVFSRPYSVCMDYHFVFSTSIFSSPEPKAHR